MGNEADGIRIVEVVIWPLVGLVFAVLFAFYQLARLAITGRGMAAPQARGELGETDRASVRGFQRG